MKTVLRASGMGAVLLAVSLLISGCYTQLGTVGDESSSSSPYDEYSNQDTTQTYSNDMSQYYNGYDDNFYGTNSFSRYRFFSFYYPTSYWNWAYDPWYDYSWNNPWYNPWYNPYYGGGYWGGYPYYGGGYYGYYPYSPGSYVGNGPASNGTRSPFGQDRGTASSLTSGRGRRGSYTVETPAVDLPRASSIQGASRSGSVQPSSTAAPSVNQPRGSAVSRPSGNSGNRTSATPSAGSTNRGRSEGRGYSQPSSRPSSPPPASSGGSRSSGGTRSGGGGERGGGGQRSGGGGRGR